MFTYAAIYKYYYKCYLKIFILQLFIGLENTIGFYMLSLYTRALVNALLTSDSSFFVESLKFSIYTVVFSLHKDTILQNINKLIDFFFY